MIMQVLGLTAEQVKSLPAPERQQINMLVSSPIFSLPVERKVLMPEVTRSASNLGCHLLFERRNFRTILSMGHMRMLH
jgi:hypothetical protein